MQHMQTGADEAAIRAYYRDMVTTLQNELVLMSTLRGNSFIVSYEDHMVAEREDTIGYDVLMRMELLTPLPQLIGKGMCLKDVVALGLDQCSALMLCEKMHIVHRDIKPDNIFISEFGHYKLGDFGVARQMEMTQGAMSRKGTPHYMAPELMLGGASGKEVDQYSLGLVLHNLLNGHRIPFADVSSRLPTLAERDEAYRRRMMGEAIPPPILGSSQLKQAVCKAASYHARDRYPSAAAFREALQNCQADLRDDTPLNTALLIGEKARQSAVPPKPSTEEEPWQADTASQTTPIDPMRQPAGAGSSAPQEKTKREEAQTMQPPVKRTRKSGPWKAKRLPKLIIGHQRSPVQRVLLQLLILLILLRVFGPWIELLFELLM